MEAVRWETTSCPLCGNRDEDVLLRVPGESAEMRLARCRSCVMTYLNPRPDPATIKYFYPAEYRPYQRVKTRKNTGAIDAIRRWVWSDVLGDPPAVTGWRRLVAKIARPWLRPSPDSSIDFPYHGQGRILDYGCGAGWLSARLRDRGFDVTAMDFSEHAARHVRETYGIPALVGTIPHPDLTPASFDVIVLGAVLEHVHDPHALIGEAARLLVPGGRLVVSVPNVDSFAFRAFGADWFSLDLPRHLLHFSPTTLRTLVERHGFAVDVLRQQARTSWMKRSLDASRRNGQGKQLWRRLASNSLIANWLTRWTMATGQADSLFLIATNTGNPSRTAIAA